MSYFDIDPRASDDILSHARQNPMAMPSAGFLDGSLTAAPKGLFSGIVAKPALLLGDAVTPLLTPAARSVDSMFGGTTVTDWLKREQDKNVAMVRDIMPDERTGLAGQVIFGGADVLPGAVAGTVVGGPAGGAAVTGALQGYASMRVAESQGVDPLTAFGKGVIEGGTMAAGVLLPGAVAGSLVKSVAVGVGSNVALGMAQRAGVGTLLEQRGYAKLAEQYKTFDTESVVLDTILGAAFGVLGSRGHGAVEKPGVEQPAYQPATPLERGVVQPSVVDSALAMSSKQHVELGTALGVPVDPVASQAHVKALNAAVNDLMAGRDVDVSASGVTEAAFVPVRSETRAAVGAVLEDLHPLRQALDAVDELRAKAAELGIAPPDEPLLTGRSLPDEAFIAGRRAEVFVGDRPEPVRFEVVEADSLAPQIGKAENQYRDRTRAASLLQIQKIATNLQFGRLGDAPTMAEGAPTLAQDGRVIGGNGRVAAVRQAYEAGGADLYREHLTARAGEFGLDPAAIQGMDKPVLVRRFENDVNVREASILSNEGGALGMSALEQAKVDAERMPSLADLNVPESGDLGAAGARDFMRRWLANMPLDQAAKLVDADGKMSAEGLMRARNALLFKAYGDSPTLARLVESTDEAQKNVANGLVKAAANVAEARDAIQAGDLHDLDIQPQLLQAVEQYAELRASGMSVDTFVNQGDMFGTGIGAEAVSLMRFMEANKRSTKALAEVLTDYYDAVRAIGDPKQASMFEAQPPSRAEILAAVLKGEAVEPKIAITVENGQYGGKIPASEGLPPEHAAIEARFANAILADVDKAITDYAKLPDSDGGKILNTDIARDLSPDYNATKDSRSALSAAVHEPASWLIKEIYRRKLAEAPSAGERPVVTFTAGGTGAGKSTAIANVPQAKMMTEQSQIVYDTNMNTLSSAQARIQQAMAAGKKVDFVYVARDPVVALTDGALPRAMRQGRTVPLHEHAKTHVGSRDVALRLIEEFKDDPNFRATIIDNTGPMGSQSVADIALFGRIDYNNLEARLRAALESEYKNGHITEVVYRGTTAGDAAARGLGGAEVAATGRGEGAGQAVVRDELPSARGDSGADVRGESAAEQPGPSADALTGEQTSQILESIPNATLVDEAGQQRTAAVAVADADAAIARADSDAPGYDAAVACFLRG